MPGHSVAGMASSRKTRTNDGLVNAATGLGTSRDPRSSAGYVAGRFLTQQEIHAAYMGAGLIRKIVGIPAFDAVREWRDWRAEQDQIKLLEAEEQRLGLIEKVLLAETLRGMGGSALILGLPGDPSQPAPSTIGKGGLAFVNVVSRWHLQFSAVNDDPTTPLYGEPVMWVMQTKDGRRVQIHPSRVISFRADGVAGMVANGVDSIENGYWGMSTVQHVIDAVKDSDTARQAFSALLSKAKLLRIGIPGLMDLVSDAEGEETLQKRIAVLAQFESLLNATIYDAGDPQDGTGGEKIDDAVYNFAGAKDVLNAFADFVSAIADIPSTRLLGRAPEGMNSSGTSQQDDWDKKVLALQKLFIGPRLSRLDLYLIASALGSRPDSVWWEFAPLNAPDEDKAATRFKTVAEALAEVRLLAAIPDVAFNKAAQNTLIEGGYMPGLDQALEDIPEEERFGLVADPSAADPVAKGGDQGLSAGAGGGTEAPPPGRATADAFFVDAAPRPLYVQRKLLNAKDVIAWAKANGFTSTLAPDDMHVTVLYSRTPVDPMKMGESWSGDDQGRILVKPGGPRVLERFGENAVVLLFSSLDLEMRHRGMVDAGGSHDWDDYHPHVTISYDVPADVDLTTIKPYQGALEFGPELFEPLDLDWKRKITEA